MGLFDFLKKTPPKPQPEQSRPAAPLNAFSPAPIDTSKYKKLHDPSENQLRYAQKLGIHVPTGAKSQDLSAIIDRVEDPNLFPATVDLLLYAQSLGREPSPYSSDVRCVGEIVHKSAPEERCAFYAYAVECSMRGVKLGDPRKTGRSEIYKKIGQQLSTEEDVLKSVDGRPFEDYVKPSKSTKAYKRTVELLQSNAN